MWLILPESSLYTVYTATKKGNFLNLCIQKYELNPLPPSDAVRKHENFL